MIKKYLMCIESIIALSICLIIFTLVSKFKTTIISPSKEKMTNIQISHGLDINDINDIDGNSYNHKCMS